jgi:hypothetical protein
MTYDYYIEYIFEIILVDQSVHRIFYKKEGQYDLLKKTFRPKIPKSTIYADKLWHICNPKKINEYQTLICDELKVEWVTVSAVYKDLIIHTN